MSVLRAGARLTPWLCVTMAVLAIVAVIAHGASVEGHLRPAFQCCQSVGRAAAAPTGAAAAASAGPLRAFGPPSGVLAPAGFAAAAAPSLHPDPVFVILQI